MKSLLTTLLLSTTVNAAKWDYIKHGKDWGKGCSLPGDDGKPLTNQTPIDLYAPGHAKHTYK
jgi:hypothetical protein